MDQFLRLAARPPVILMEFSFLSFISAKQFQNTVNTQIAVSLNPYFYVIFLFAVILLSD